MNNRLHPRLDEKEAIQHCGWPACQAACCVYGTWIDLFEVEDILANAELIKPFLPEAHQDPAGWFDGAIEPDPHALGGQVTHTSVLDDPGHYGGTACVFLCSDYRCALQAAGEANGLHPWRFKPFYCILHPLDLDEHGRITLDETHRLAAEPASCLRAGDSEVLLRGLFTKELDYLLGEQNQKDA